MTKIRKRLYKHEAEFLGIKTKENEKGRSQARYYINFNQWDKVRNLRSKSKSVKTNTDNNAKILIFDIETSPLRADIWSLWNQNIGYNLDMLKSDWFILTWSAKWLFKDKVYSDKIKPKEIKLEDDYRVVKSLWHMIDEADIIIAHNGVKFDVKRMNTRFLKHGLAQPSPYQIIDTLKHAKNQFNISSNKLDYICKFLGLDVKMNTGGYSLWDNCMKGYKEALDKMEKYNIQDVKILEDVYLELRPYIKPHPNLGLFNHSDEVVCPTCGGCEFENIGNYNTYVNSYDALRCNSCNSISRKRKSNKITKDNNRIIVSTPK